MKITIVVLLVTLVVLSTICVGQIKVIASLTAQRKEFVEYVGGKEMNGDIKLDRATRLRLLKYSPEAEF